MDFDKDKAYMEVLCKFRELLDTEFRDGGWMPPTDVMSQRFAVSRGTYLKAVKCLVSESMVNSYPRKGIYIVPKKFRCKKVGLVIGDGRESPFLPEGGSIAGIILALQMRGYKCQLIQSSPMSNIPRSAVSHCVSGLIWFEPPKSAHQIMSDICETNLLPLIAIRPYSPTCDEDVAPEVPCVAEDLVELGNTISGQFEKFGHHRVAYVGDNLWLTNRIGLDIIQPEDIYSSGSVIDAPGALLKKIVEQKITGIWLATGMQQIEIIFKELCSLPEDQQPEVLVNNNKYYLGLDWYPASKIIGITEVLLDELNLPAVDMLIDNIDTPEKIAHVRLPTYRIIPGTAPVRTGYKTAMN